MHWADKVAEDLIAQRPDVEVYTCASGISPSGQIHIGNFRDIATIWFVGKALRERGKRVRLIHSWDDYDRFRKVPRAKIEKEGVLPSWLVARIQAFQIPEEFEKYLGLPLASVPDPFGEYASYAERFERDFESALAELGVEIEFLHQATLYPSGVYREGILEAVRKREQIFEILSRVKSQPPTEEERARFLPISVYCQQCGRDTTRAALVDGSETEVHYTCGACKHEATLDLTTATNVKLPWRVDWAMRWRYEGVVFEPGGKDHATAGGSFESSSQISREVFGYEPPVFEPYEFIGIKGLGGKMSSSTGVLLKPADLLEIYQPEIIMWMYARFAPMKQFDIAVDDQVLRMYDEFDRALTGDPQIETDVRALELARIPGREIHPVSFRQLTGFSGIAQGDADALEAIFAKMGTPHPKATFEERLRKAESWLERYVPEQHIALRTDRNLEFYETLLDTERAWVHDLYEWLRSADAVSVDEATERVYAIPKRAEMTDKEASAAQKRFFQVVYRLLFDATRGPRLGTFVAVVPRDRFLHLLEFQD